jgi:hypothetical protein
MFCRYENIWLDKVKAGQSYFLSTVHPSAYPNQSNSECFFVLPSDLF